MSCSSICAGAKLRTSQDDSGGSQRARRGWLALGKGTAAEPVGNVEPRKPYDIANVLAAVAVLCFLAAAVILFYSFSHKAAPPSANVPTGPGTKEKP